MSSSEFEANSYPGICEICGEGQVFTRTHRAIRETYQCRKCRGLLRERAQASVVVACYAPAGVRTLAELVEGPSFRTLCVYEPGTTGAFRRYLRRLPMYYQSDYVPESERGLAATASPDQDLESLTYPSSFFDLVISSDILEHVRRPSAAFREIARVLKPGGRHILTVPLQHPLPPVTVARVDTSGDDDRTLLPERYHGNGREEGRSSTPTLGAILWRSYGKLGLTGLSGPTRHQVPSPAKP